MATADQVLRNVYDPNTNTLVVRVDATDDIVGNREYDYNEILTDDESMTDSFNAIATFLHNEYYQETFAVGGYQDITKSSGVNIYTISQDENANTPEPINDGTVIIQDTGKFLITDTNGNPIYKQGSILKSEENLVKVNSYNVVTQEITLNHEPKTDFRVNFLIKYTRENLPNGKALTNGIYVVENEASQIAYDNSDSDLSSDDVQEAISEIDNKAVYDNQENTLNGRLIIDNNNFVVLDDLDNEIFKVDANTNEVFVNGVKITGTYGG